jgi:hypothetical protein
LAPLDPPPNFCLVHKKTYMIMFRRFTSDDLYARGEQFSEPQDGPQGHYWSGVPPPAVDLGPIHPLKLKCIYFTIAL